MLTRCPVVSWTPDGSPSRMGGGGGGAPGRPAQRDGRRGRGGARHLAEPARVRAGLIGRFGHGRGLPPDVRSGGRLVGASGRGQERAPAGPCDLPGRAAYPADMERDLRQTTVYREIEEHFRTALEPAFGRISGAVDPAPSPDGGTIAFTGSRIDRLEGPPETRICVVDTDSGEVREITGGPHHDRLPKWSPDGARLAFLSDRASPGRFQPYLLEAGTVGEAAAAPEVEGTVEY